jgi:predicted deacetylase
VSLLVAIHDVAPVHLDTVARLRETLAGWGVAQVTLLAVPHFHGGTPLGRSPATLAWLRARAEAGDEVCLHGHFHVQRRAIPRRLDRLRARLWTAGEAECLALGAVARARMLVDEKRALEDQLGCAVPGFVAPAWLEPRGFGRELARAGFGWHEGSTWIERLDDSTTTRWRLPVIGFATRTWTREQAACAWARLAAPFVDAAARLGLAPARVAFHPADVGSARVMRVAERAVKQLLRFRGSASYATALKISATRREVNAAL